VFQEGFPPVIASETHIDELGGCGDVAYARLTYSYQVVAGGRLVEDIGRALWILRKCADRVRGRGPGSSTP
jgi:ketosteroid isomerase-like protein